MLLSSKNDEDDSGLDQSCARFDDDRTAIHGDTKTTELCFLDDGVDWSRVRLCGELYRIKVQDRKCTETHAYSKNPDCA